MTNASRITPTEPEAAIDALLARDEQASIVDGLFALPGSGAAPAPDPWSRVVHDRLQARLAARMRRVISSGDEEAA